MLISSHNIVLFLHNLSLVLFDYRYTQLKSLAQSKRTRFSSKIEQTQIFVISCLNFNVFGKLTRPYRINILVEWYFLRYGIINYMFQKSCYTLFSLLRIFMQWYIQIRILCVIIKLLDSFKQHILSNYLFHF